MKNFDKNYDFENELSDYELSSFIAHLIVKEMYRIICDIRKEIEENEEGD